MIGSKPFIHLRENGVCKISSKLLQIKQIWSEITSLKTNDAALAINWLENERGLNSASRFVGSGFTCLSENHLSLFNRTHQNFLKRRLGIGRQLLVPLRSAHSDEVKNIFFRTITPCEKNDKVCILPNVGGWSESDESPRAFGFPNLIMEFRHLILCEGMADYFAAECLLEDNEKFLPIGVANADAFKKWADWLVQNNYSGHISIVYHLDRNEHGNLSKNNVGQLKATQALSAFRKHGLKAHLFDWPTYIENITTHTNEINDLADCLKTEAIYRECGPGHLPHLFSALLTFEENR